MAAILFDLFIIGIIIILCRLALTKTESGNFNRPGSPTYSYVIGNNLHYYGQLKSTYHGIEIDLPKNFPHLYLDAAKRQGLRGPRMYINPSQIVGLEGNFNQYFTAYIVPGYETLALSILTPDVLQTFKDYCNGMDVELQGKKLRIISNKRLWHRPNREEAVYIAAQKLIAEIDHKLKSWTVADSELAGQKQLVVQDTPSVRLAGRNFRLSSIIVCVVWLPISLPLWVVVYLDNQSHLYRMAGSLSGDIMIAFLFFPVLFAILYVGLPAGMFKKLAELSVRY